MTVPATILCIARTNKSQNKQNETLRNLRKQGLRTLCFSPFKSIKFMNKEVIKMWFEVDGQINIPSMLDNQQGGINVQKFCKQLITNQVRIVGYKTSAEIEKWKKYYEDMHPRQYLTEDVLQTSITEEEIKTVFGKFFKSLSADSCRVTIIDPYIFATTTKVDLLISVLKSNVGSKQLRFITTDANSNLTVKNEIKTKLSDLGFSIFIENKNDIHDRWWYTRIKGFYCGSSFNGIGRKATMLNAIPDKDLNNIIELFGI